MNAFNEQTITYGAGRFVAEIPAAMQFGGGYSLRTCAVEEVVWQTAEPLKEATALFDARAEAVKRITPAEGHRSAVVEFGEVPGVGTFCKSILYIKEPLDPDYANLELLVNKGATGLWVKIDGKLPEKKILYDVATEMAQAYRPASQRFGRVAVLKGRDSFYLKYGAIDLPFEYRESVDLTFKGHPLDEDMILGIETEVVEKADRKGLADRLEAMVAGNFAPGLKIEKIRSNQRKVADIEGEEMVYRGIEPDGTKGLYMLWEFPGEAGMSHFPDMTIRLITADGHMDEKLALWDAVLDAVRPAGR